MDSTSSIEAPPEAVERVPGGPVPDPDAESGPLARYRDAEARQAATLATVRAEMRRVESARLTTFLVASIIGLLYAELPIGPMASLAVATLAAVAFVVLVVRHRRLKRVERRTEVGHALARLGRLRLWRQWEEIATELDAIGYSDPLLAPLARRWSAHPYVADLDVFGPASLRTLLGPTPTPTGVATLRDWLSAPASGEEVARRRSAVGSLAPDVDAREALETEALLVEPAGERAWAAFTKWLNAPPLFSSEADGPPGWSIIAARILPPVSAILFGLFTAGLVPAWSWWIPVGLQGVLLWRWGRAFGDYFDGVAEGARALRRYHALLEAWEGYDSDDPTIRELRGRLEGAPGREASTEIRRLERWLDLADSRASMLYVALAWGLLSDVHIAWGLERWRALAGARAEGWFEALGELEALSALATLAYDHPEWCWPELGEGEPGLEAESLGHPLLPEPVMRSSDVTVDGPGRFLLVTGSNMSGKSTLLRSLGLAAVMAQAGSVVCARRLSMTPLRTFTSMRISDSLTEGVSLFMAELNRLKALVDAAEPGSGGAGGGDDGADDLGGAAPPALLYLIDEVMQGTNSEERRVAARHIVSHLLDAHAIGAVTTHDLSLHEEPRLDEAATKVHFRERVGGGDGGAVLTFDYKLRPGLATSRNALKLLALVGLSVPHHDHRGDRTGEGATGDAGNA